MAFGGNICIIELTGGPHHEGMVNEIVRQIGNFILAQAPDLLNVVTNTVRTPAAVWAPDAGFIPVNVPDPTPLAAAPALQGGLVPTINH